jgi:hypothetical protein
VTTWWMGIGAMMEFWAPDVRVVEEVEEEEELMVGIRKMSLTLLPC